MPEVLTDVVRAGSKSLGARGRDRLLAEKASGKAVEFGMKGKAETPSNASVLTSVEDAVFEDKGNG